MQTLSFVPGAHTMKLWIFMLLILLLTGCAQDQPVPVQPVSIKSSDFCEIVSKPRDLTWSVQDTPATITSLRRLGAKWDTRCGKTTSKPTS